MAERPVSDRPRLSVQGKVILIACIALGLALSWAVSPSFGLPVGAVLALCIFLYRLSPYRWAPALQDSHAPLYGSPHQSP